MRRTSVVLAVAVLVALPSLADDLESRAKGLENRLMAPCCMANTVSVHESGPAQSMRAEIRQMLAGGMSDSAILDVYVERHGPLILAMPPARGFNLTPYLAPVGLLLVGTVSLLVAMRRWRRGNRAEEERPAPPPLSEPEKERVRRALRELEG